MPENTNTQKKYQISKSQARGFYNAFISALNQVLIFFSLRQPRKFWGVVYDSLSKLPLDPVIVKLVYTDGREVVTNISDMSGKYAFLAGPGKFKILAKKTNYLFPSKIVQGSQDGFYNHLYHGEFFEVSGDYAVVAPNIPMDGQKSDWNEQAKKLRSPKHPYYDYFLHRLVAIFFWFGFFWAAILAFRHEGTLTVRDDIWSAIYLVFIILIFITPRTRLLGQVKQELFTRAELELELTRPELPGVIFGKAVVVPDGRFLLRAQPGKYMVQVKFLEDGKQVKVLGQVPVHATSDGVINSTIRITAL